MPTSDMASDVKAGHLEHVTSDRTGGAVPIVAFYPSSRHLPNQDAAVLNAMATRISRK